MNLSIIIPCYNESENVPKLRDELLPVIRNLIAKNRASPSETLPLTELIFVDDGSRDETSQKLKDGFSHESQDGLTFKFIKHEKNLGLGAAIRTGFSNAEGDIIVTVDSDGTYKFSDIPALLSLLTTEVDIVTASPYHPKGNVAGVPAGRLILSRGSSLIYRILVDWHVHTYTCLFRAYRSEVIRNIEFNSNDFLGGTELLVNAMFCGYRVAEFPAVLYKREYGVSKARIVQTIRSHLGFQGWILLRKTLSVLGIKPMQRIKSRL